MVVLLLQNNPLFFKKKKKKKKKEKKTSKKLALILRIGSNSSKLRPDSSLDDKISSLYDIGW